MKKFSAILQLTRPVNVIIAMCSVFIAALITGTLSPIANVILACLSAGLITAGANTINDYYDIAIDQINKPDRPLARGLISPGQAFWASLIQYFFGNLFAIFISPLMFAIALFFSLLTYLYSARLKRTVLWGNIAVSLSTAAAFIYGGSAVHRPREAVIPALFAFFFHFGREIIKDMEDVAGDRENNAITFPVKYGMPPSIQLVSLNFVILILLTIFPFWAGWYGEWYFLIIVIGIYPLILYTIYSIRNNTSPTHLHRLSNLLKADMLVGLLAIYFR